MFCPGDGMLFVGLSEETFLDHALRTHGEKVMRCRPEKLRRECRICGEVCFTDTELGDHIKREHIYQRKCPFAGFGPKTVSDSESDSEEEEGQTRYSSTSKVGRRSARREEKTEKSVRKTFRQSMTNRKRHGRSVEDIERVERSQETVRRKRRRQEDEVRCVLCGAEERAGLRMLEHLARSHRTNCFSCARPECGGLAWTSLEEAARHVEECVDLERGGEGQELVARGLVTPPTSLECQYCLYCSPDHMIVAASWEEMQTALFAHMEQHEELHRGNMEDILANTGYGCRLCDKKFRNMTQMDEHIQRHRKEARSRPVRNDKSRSSSKRSGELRKEVRWSVSCRFCSASWPGEPDKAVLRQHREHHPEKITSTNDCFQRSCQTCGFLCSYGDFRIWQTHLSEKHPGATEVNNKSDSELQCSYCYEIFSQRKLKSHISEAHLKEVIQCGNCPEVFPVKSDAVTHMMREHWVSEDQAERLIVVPGTEKLSAVSCLICHWDVLGGGQLEMEFHMNIKHGTSDTSRVQYFCRLCGKNKAFRDEKILRNHLKEHDRDGRFKRFSREDWNKNSISNINKHLTGGMKERQDRRAEEVEDNFRRPGTGSWYDSREQSHQRRFRETGGGSSSRGFHPRHMQLPGPRIPGFPESRSGWRGHDRGERDGRFGPGVRGVGRGRGGRVGVRGGYHDGGAQAWTDKCQEVKAVQQEPSRPSAIEETRNEIETMMRQLDEERAAAADCVRVKDVIQLVLEDILGKVFQSEELNPVFSQVISPPGSPVYCPPSIDSEEDMSPVSDENEDCLSYECTECYLRMSVKFEVFQHLEEVHGVQGEEEFLNRRVKEIKSK